ncbi:3-hydroxyacyl-CoA dehydrogenase family protein [Plantactinospora sp. GCM10030261]|uniref:3-hydroxyacyl-CoA dehydrogenase family protein n=1 Tax=Plantactinospora sp. GCM10030261 TaxID=3273420 RepID=UPI003621ACA1
MTDRFVVIGAGTMGLGIAYVAAGAGFRVDLVEVDAGRASAAEAALRRLWDAAVARGKLTAADADASRARLTVGGDVAEVAEEPAVIVEAVPERLDLKRDVLAAAEARRPALLATNTSSIPISELSTGLRAPDRFLGLHFFNPVWAMALIEVVVGPATAPAAAEAAVTLAGRLGKDPIVVRDMPGFATSRLGVTLGLEAIRMVADGVASPADIDKAMVLGYRHPVGPLELTDLVGLDVRLDIARTLHRAYGDRFAPPPLLESMVAEGRLGKKTGHGFYRWEGGKRQ